MSEANDVRQRGCCDQDRVPVERVRLLNQSRTSGIYNTAVKLTPQTVDYKALIYYFGKQGSYSVKRVGLIGSSSRLGQVAQSIGSYVIPGNISPYRSPIRSALYGALIPGLPGGRGGRAPRKRTHRCPEGYQYGGRFTDNRLSTCGQQLFDLPGPLGLAIGAVRRIAREIAKAGKVPVVGTPLGAGDYTDPLESRRPQIPRVAERNAKLMQESIDRLLREMGEPGISAMRMVRRDGFVLQPVVTPRVLRSIPDNRDMEGATFILTANKLADLGQDELGLLSNTGVEQLIYVLPGGSNLSLRKTRKLEIGERRKLGRTVNAAIDIDNSKEPIARINYVSTETGDGIEYSESFVGVKNPHEIIKLPNGRTSERWVAELFGKKKGKEVPSGRETSSSGPAQKRITSLTEATEHLAAGGSLSAIDPEILGQALAKANLFKKKKLSSGIEEVTSPDGKTYILNRPSKDFEHINSIFASDFQQHLGIESPDVTPVGVGNRRSYLTQSFETTYPGIKPSRDKTINDASSSSVAKMLISDFVSGVENRSPSSIEIIEIGDEVLAVPTVNDTTLTDLADIKIRQRTEKLIESFKSLQESGVYGQYYRELQEQQRRKILSEVKKLIERARLFNYVNFVQRLSVDGSLTAAEKRHIKIVQRIAEQRVGVLENILDTISDILKGSK